MTYINLRLSEHVSQEIQVGSIYSVGSLLHGDHVLAHLAKLSLRHKYCLSGFSCPDIIPVELN